MTFMSELAKALQLNPAFLAHNVLALVIALFLVSDLFSSGRASDAFFEPLAPHNLVRVDLVADLAPFVDPGPAEHPLEVCLGRREVAFRPVRACARVSAQNRLEAIEEVVVTRRRRQVGRAVSARDDAESACSTSAGEPEEIGRRTR